MLNGVEIVSNTAGSDGGGVCLVSGDARLSAGEVAGNTAAVDGGGVFVGFSSTAFTQTGGSSIAYNTAEYGGGVYVY